ncbi:MAG: MltA domain-containing protein [Rickettsiales bacterium]|nr:MltA domain-containing protein [Rickettsiales bacterium]
MTPRTGVFSLHFCRAFAVTCVCLILSSCWWEAADAPTLYPVAYEHLPGWENDQLAEAYRTLGYSCGQIMHTAETWERHYAVTGGGTLRLTLNDLKEACIELLDDSKENGEQNHAKARAFFERTFVPYQLTRDGYPAGLITGYYAPVLHGSFTQTKRYRWPAYRLPPEMLGQRAEGDIPDRAAIDAGALQGRGLELLWVDDPVMLFFLHVQGSGFVEMTNGERVQLRYAGKNGLPYVAIGRLMADKGLLPLEQVTLPSIQAWLRAHPEQQADIFALNPSYVFFSLEKNMQPVQGAQGVPLSDKRSLAIDQTLYPYGLPMFLTTAIPATDTSPSTLWQRLMVSQDTGSAIRGPVRADVYFGEDSQAEALAGMMKAPGSLVILIPKRAAVRFNEQNSENPSVAP